MIGLALSYLAVAGALCMTFLASDTRKLLIARVTLAIVTPLMCIAVWLALAERPGWAHPGLPPAHSSFLWGGAREPDPQTGDRGKIFLLVVPPQATQPRLYSIPYSRQVHEQLNKAERHRGRSYSINYGVHARKHRLYLEPPAAPPSKR